MSTQTYVKAAHFKLFDLNALCTLKTYPGLQIAFPGVGYACYIYHWKWRIEIGKQKTVH